MFPPTRKLEPMKHFIAFGDVAAHNGAVVQTDTDDESWTYQSAQPWAHCSTVIEEGSDEAAVRAALAEWLECDATERGVYCYTHNPHPS